MPGILWRIVLVNDGLSKSSGGIKKRHPKEPLHNFINDLFLIFVTPIPCYQTGYART